MYKQAEALDSKRKKRKLQIDSILILSKFDHDKAIRKAKQAREREARCGGDGRQTRSNPTGTTRRTNVKRDERRDKEK